MSAHTWHDHTKVEEYLDRVGGLAPRLAGEAALVEVISVVRVQRAADLGCGDGRLAAIVLDTCPGVTEMVAVDASPPMLAKARERFHDDPRVRVIERDLRDDVSSLGDFDLVVSGFAIHHLDDARKRELSGEVAGRLDPAVCSRIWEIVKSATPELHAAFRAAIGRAEDDPEDQLADVETQLDWLRAAGLDQVDCLWRWRGFALLIGTKPEPGR